MVADKGKKSKVVVKEESVHIDGDLILSMEKLQEVQDELEKVLYFFFYYILLCVLEFFF